MIKFQQVIRDHRWRSGTLGLQNPIRRPPQEKPIRNRWRRLNIFLRWCPSSSSHRTSRQPASTHRQPKVWFRIHIRSWLQIFKVAGRTLPPSRVQTQLLASLISSTFSNGSRARCVRMRSATKHKRVHTGKMWGSHRCRTARGQMMTGTVLTTSCTESTI